MEKERNTPLRKPGTKLILTSFLAGCIVALAFNFYQNERNKTEIQSDIKQSAFPYTLMDVNKVLDAQLAGWNNGNIDQFMEGYIKDSSVRFITNKKVKKSWREITDSYKKGYPNKDAMGKLSFHRDEIRWVDEFKGIAQVIGRWEVIQKHRDTVPHSQKLDNQTTQGSHNQNIRTQDTLSGRFSLIFVGTKDGPKILIDHTW